MPSEHTIEAIPFPMEMQLIHKNNFNEYLIIAILFEQGGITNQQLNKFWGHFPKKIGELSHEHVFNFKRIFPRKKHYYTYEGSLTSPPCSENVHWVIMQEYVIVSKEQIRSFEKIYRYNARPTFPLQGRIIKSSIE